MAKRGVNLLLGHLNGSKDSLDTAMANQDEQALIVASDPLITVATILVRKLRDASDGTVESALALVRQYSDPHIVPVDQLAQVEALIKGIISEGFYGKISVSAAAVALIAHDIAEGAANEISKIDGRHINKVVADLHNELKRQGDDVQITDRSGANAASEKYAADLGMRRARQDAAGAFVDYWHRVAVTLHNTAQHGNLENVCSDSLEALALIAVTINALTAGVYQLAAQANIYPAWTLIRQIVETEFILWRFMNEPTQIPRWMHSTPDERRLNWKPSKIYRDGDNDYRQKDYWYHCELGGHPTPDGARVIVGSPYTPIALASALNENIAHSWEAWRHLTRAVQLVGENFRIEVPDEIAVIDRQYKSTIEDWTQTDMYRHTAAFFSDPID